jgi:hypothetical protein
MTLTRDQILQKAAEAEAAAERFAGGGDTYATMNASAYRQRAADWRARAAEMPAQATAAAALASDPALRAAILAARASEIAEVRAEARTEAAAVSPEIAAIRAEAIALIRASAAQAELDDVVAEIAAFNPSRPVVALKAFSTGNPLADSVASYLPGNRASASRIGTPLADPAAEALAMETASYGQHEASDRADEIDMEADGIAAFMPKARRA